MKRPNTHRLLLLLLVSVMVTSCYKDNEETLYPGDCNTTAVSYSATVQPLLANNCVSCHSGASASGGVLLDNYASVVEVAGNGSLLGTVKHSSGYPSMPQGGAALSDCSVSQIEAWITQGTLNN